MRQWEVRTSVTVGVEAVTSEGAVELAIDRIKEGLKVVGLALITPTDGEGGTAFVSPEENGEEEVAVFYGRKGWDGAESTILAPYQTVTVLDDEKEEADDDAS